MAATPTPVLEEVAALDLAYLENEIKREKAKHIPSLSRLMKRWGWKQWAVRKFLASHESHTNLTRSAHRVKRKNAGNGDDSAPKPHDTHTKATQKGDPFVPLREEEKKKEEEAVWNFWRTLSLPDGSQPHNGARSLRKPHRPLLRARIDEDDAATVMLVFECYHLGSPGEFHREKDYLGIDNLCRAGGWDSKVEKARKWKNAGKPVAGQPPEDTEPAPPSFLPFGFDND